MLQVTVTEGESVREITTGIEGLEYKEITTPNGTYKGFDITEVEDIIKIAEDYNISTTSEVKHEWNFKVIFVNLDSDQQANTGKVFIAEAKVQKDKAIVFLADYIKSLYTSQGENGLYLHDSTLENGAGDGSYRYAGADPSNYVCFGSDEATCPDDNLYRVIGVFDNQVKLIKDDYASKELLGEDGSYAVMISEEGTTDESLASGGYKGQMKANELATYYWYKKRIKQLDQPTIGDIVN